eukprot:scaffold55_cov401-Prasinococcus_capsulatus_cf.AAC.7
MRALLSTQSDIVRDLRTTRCTGNRCAADSRVAQRLELRHGGRRCIPLDVVCVGGTRPSRLTNLFDILPVCFHPTTSRITSGVSSSTSSRRAQRARPPGSVAATTRPRPPATRTEASGAGWAASERPSRPYVYKFTPRPRPCWSVSSSSNEGKRPTGAGSLPLLLLLRHASRPHARGAGSDKIRGAQTIDTTQRDMWLPSPADPRRTGTRPHITPYPGNKPPPRLPRGRGLGCGGGDERPVEDHAATVAAGCGGASSGGDVDVAAASLPLASAHNVPPQARCVTRAAACHERAFRRRRAVHAVVAAAR